MLKVALFGIGRWGQNIFRTLAENPECIVSVVCDPNPDAVGIMKAIAPHITPTIYHNWEEAIKDTTIDAAIIATPASTHAHIAIPLLEQGISVFIEKPVALSVSDVKRIEEAAAKTGAKIFVGHIHLYNPAYHAIKEYLPSLGTLRYISCEGGNNGPYRSDMSALWDWAPHDIAAIIDIFKAKPKVIDAFGYELLRPGQNLHDMVSAHLEANNIPVMLNVSWLMPEKRKKITFVGETSSLVFDDTAKDKVVVYENMGPAVNGTTVTFQAPTATPLSYDQTSPLANELAAFINAITKNTPYPTGITHALAVTQVLAEIEAKIKTT